MERRRMFGQTILRWTSRRFGSIDGDRLGNAATVSALNLSRRSADQTDLLQKSVAQWRTTVVRQDFDLEVLRRRLGERKFLIRRLDEPQVLCRKFTDRAEAANR